MTPPDETRTIREDVAEPPTTGESPTSSRWFFVDDDAALVHVVPSIAGIEEDVRCAVYDRCSGKYVHFVSVPAGSNTSIYLAKLDPHTSLSVKLQARRENGWVDVGSLQSILPSTSHEVHEIVPGEWGVHEPCVATVLDPETREIIWRGTFLDPEARRSCILNFSGGRKLGLTFRGIDQASGRPGQLLASAIRLVPASQRLESRISPQPEHLRTRTYDDVVLEPICLHSSGGNSWATHGIVGAWNNEDPIPEAMDFVIGKQSYLFRPKHGAPQESVPGTVIYMGRPHKSWGHFLTEGLARAWYAARHPTTPTLWDGPALSGYQLEILERVGVTNPRLHLSRTTRFEHVVFPVPGVGLGDYLTKEFAQFAGTFTPRPVVPGNKVLLSRSALAEEVGAKGDQALKLDHIAEAHGFRVFHPQLHELEEQLEVISSAETVLAMEGSALHTILLLGDPVRTKFWALTRHRGGSGVYEHIRHAKGLSYETLNFLTHRPRTARADFELDLDALDAALACTAGFSRNLEILAPRLEHPSSAQYTRRAQMNNLQVALSASERIVVAAMSLLEKGDQRSAQRVLDALI